MDDKFTNHPPTGPAVADKIPSESARENRPPAFLSAPPFFVFSIPLGQLKKKADKMGKREKRKGRTKPLFSGTRDGCLDFIARKTRHAKQNLDNFIIISQATKKEEKWSIKELPV